MSMTYFWWSFFTKVFEQMLDVNNYFVNLIDSFTWWNPRWEPFYF